VSAPACRALDDLRPLELGEGAEHRQRELVLRIVDVVLVSGDDLPPAPQEFVNDDVLVGHLPGEAVGGVEIYRVEDVSLGVLPQRFKCGPVEHCGPIEVRDQLSAREKSRSFIDTLIASITMWRDRIAHFSVVRWLGALSRKQCDDRQSGGNKSPRSEMTGAL
jgi:hypothetical protein